MRRSLLFCSIALGLAAPAQASDQLKFGSAPAWVVPVAIPPAPTTRANAPVLFLLKDQQSRLEPGRIVTFSEFALKIQNAEGLAAGNIAFPWQPSTDTVTVNKVHILRDGQTIDVLAAGQTFTTVRRETNLEAAMLDGTLTATLQPEGLRVGDILRVAVTTEHVDPILKGHVEGTFASWNMLPIEVGHVRLSWPSTLDLITRVPADLPPAVRSSKDGITTVEFTGKAVEPLVLPRGAPPRFAVVREAEVSDFRLWADVSRLMLPLYTAAAVIPPAGPLRDELNRIRREGKTSTQRAELALQLVEDRVRYVALLMGSGGYVPATAETTWSRRFGDCKAKTALLLGLLRELRIEADPVLVHTRMGDALAERLPMVSYFDHVIVRAKVDGKTYWLDGTRTGDSSLATLEVPNLGWGLPVVPGGELTRIVPPPLNRPSFEARVDIDASKGVFTPALFTGENIIRGDLARSLNAQLSSVSSAQLNEMLRQMWKSTHDFLTVETAGYDFDKQRAEIKLTVAGKAKLPWDDGWLFVPGSTMAYNPDFDRTAGPSREAPFAVNYPSFEIKRTIIRLPAGFAAGQSKIAPPVRTTLAGMEYGRTVTLKGDTLTVETSERALAPEVSYKEALASSAGIKALHEDDVHLRLPRGYAATDQDINSRLADTPATAAGFVERGSLLLNARKLDEARADFDKAIELDSDNAVALAGRGISLLEKGEKEAGQRDLAKAHSLEPGNPAVARSVGHVAEINGDLDTALNSYSAVLAKDPDNVFFLVRRAAAYHRLGEHSKAIADTDRALKAGYNDPTLRLLRANVFRNSGDAAGAAAEAKAMVEGHPKNGFALVAAGKTYAALGRHQEAMAAFDRAIAVEPEAYVYINRAQARPASDAAGRLADLDAALKLEPDNIDALLVKAEQLQSGDDFKGALTLYERATALKPDDGNVTLTRAILLHKLGRADEASKLVAPLRATAKSAVQLNNLCWRKGTAGMMLDSALQDCRDALKLAPGHAAYLDSLGMVLLKTGRLDEALAAYGEAIEKRAGATSYMGRAFVHQQKGDEARARADTAAATRLDADILTTFEGYGLRRPGANQTTSK